MKKLMASASVSALLSTSALAGGFVTQQVSFENEGSTLAGTLYLPADYQSGDRLPMVVVTGAWTSVQQQMPAQYAEQMVDRGFAAFTFDFRGWGQSGDQPNQVRYKESPSAKVSDINAAIAYIATRPEVDDANIHGLGICASAGYMVDAVSGNEQVRSIGLVAPWLQNQEIVNAVYGGEAGVAQLINVSRQAEADGNVIIPAAGPDGAEGVLMPISGYYYEPSRGAIPEYDNKWNQASWEGWLTYYPADNPQRLDKPLAVVHSEAAAIPDGVKTFLSGYLGDATLQMLENVTQFDFYDNPEDVSRAADTVAQHFKTAGNS